MKKEECKTCGGCGWYKDHDMNDTRTEHYEDGDCQSCPIQVECEECKENGFIIKPRQVLEK